MSGCQELLRSLPAVDRVLHEDALSGLVDQLPQERYRVPFRVLLPDSVRKS